VIQVWHTLTPKNYMRFWMSVFWCFILGPSGGFLNYFFEWDVTPDGYPLSTGKKTRGHVPPPRKKTLAKQQPRIVYTVLKKNRDGFFSNGLLWVNRKLFPARRDRWFFLLRYYFSFCPKDRSHKNFQRGTLHWVTRVLSKRTRVFVRICITIFQTRIGFFL